MVRKTHKIKVIKKGKKIRKKRKTRRRIKPFNKKDYNSNDGMLTSVWGPPAWHFLHTISFNYPVKPTCEQRKQYKEFMCSLQHVLPCGHCRKNLKKNLKQLPLRPKDLKDRHSFSLWMYKLHELVNKMLRKKSGLKYNEVRERYEHFRSRCTIDNSKTHKKRSKKHRGKTRKMKGKGIEKEKGCIKPLYGKKSKCVMKIVPHDEKTKSLSIDRKCVKKVLIK
jgi:hypothetical protein